MRKGLDGAGGKGQDAEGRRERLTTSSFARSTLSRSVLRVLYGRWRSVPEGEDGCNCSQEQEGGSEPVAPADVEGLGLAAVQSAEVEGVGVQEGLPAGSAVGIHDGGVAGVGGAGGPTVGFDGAHDVEGVVLGGHGGAVVGVVGDTEDELAACSGLVTEAVREGGFVADGCDRTAKGGLKLLVGVSGHHLGL